MSNNKIIFILKSTYVILKIGDSMNSFLKELEKNYDLFLIVDGIIIDHFKFPNDINRTFRNLLARSNPQYFKRCQEMNCDSEKFSCIELNKDASGKCYLCVYGNDNHTVLIIRQDDSRYEDYRGIAAKKITETEFINELDYVERRRLASANIPSRFIRDEALPIDICSEMNIPLLISYYRYINDYINPVEIFEEPENTVGPAQKPNPTLPRKNPIIDLDERQIELLKRDPKKIIRLEGNRSGSKLNAYIYERFGYVLAVVEPESGIEYQYDLNLGNIDYRDDELVRRMLKAALSAKEEIIMMDDAIMRKNHTTMDKFKENLDLFLEGHKIEGKFYHDIKAAQSVYHRR